MYTDVVRPKGNEVEIVKTAEKLGYKKLFFVYDKKVDVSKIETNIEICSAIISDKKSKGAITLIKSKDKLRNLIEKGSVDLILDIEDTKHDKFNQRNSGLNHILVKLMKSKKVSYGISLSSLNSPKGMLRAQIIGRIKQNIMLCKKYEVKVVFFSFAKTPLMMRAPKDIISLARVFGLDQALAKECLDNLELKGDNYICEGVELLEDV